VKQILCFLLLLYCVPAWATSGGRYALVVGNGTYPNAPLNNRVNDATDMAAKLEQRGCEVRRLLNAGTREMEDAVYEFTRRLGGKDSVGLFY